METNGSRVRVLPFWLPLLLTGYLETLRAAVFYAFGWEWSGLLLCISLLISINTCRQVYKSSRIGNILTLIGIMAFTTFSGLTSSTGLNHGLLDSAILPAYAVMFFFINSLILERKSAREVFILGTFLILTAAVASDQGIRVYLVLNLIFAFGLHSRLHLLRLETDFGVRVVKHSGINDRFWNGTALAIILVSILIAVFMPTVRGKTGGLAFLRQESDVGYYGRGSGADADFWRRLRNFDFNGNLPLNENPVLLVKANQPSYWRGEAADYYTGSGWQNSMVIRAVNENDYINPYPGIFPVRKMEQEFTFLPGFGSEVIYFAGSPTAVISESNLAADDGGNFYNRSFSNGFGYKVVSDIVDFSSDRLKTVSGEYPPEILEKYLQLPRIPERVHELARTITVSASTPYEKAKKIEAYLSSHYPYETRVFPPTGKQDVVDYFLFDLKKGYCTYHSTAMAVMLRSIGIPSRWVTGFTAGSFSPEKDTYVVTTKDAHAWVEAYIPGAGWVPFEPTSSFTIPASAEPAPVMNDASRNVTVQSKKSYVKRGQFLTVIIIAAVLYLGFCRIKMKKAKNNENKFDTVEQIYEGFLKLIAQKGYYKNVEQTPLEFAAYLCSLEDLSGYSDQIMLLTNAYLRHRFSLDKLNGDEANELKSILKQLCFQLGIKKPGLTSYQ